MGDYSYILIIYGCKKEVEFIILPLNLDYLVFLTSSKNLSMKDLIQTDVTLLTDSQLEKFFCIFPSLVIFIIECI